MEIVFRVLFKYNDRNEPKDRNGEQCMQLGATATVDVLLSFDFQRGKMKNEIQPGEFESIRTTKARQKHSWRMQ